jgi:DNA-binding transcriptional LysR family regulator
MEPSLRQLQAFVHIYQLGNLTRAADKLCITQSAVSVLLRQLEEGLGVRLFDRSSRALRPTAAAEDVLATAERILHDVAHLTHSVKGLAERNRGSLSFAVTSAVAAGLMPTVIEIFRRQYPNISLQMHDVGTNDLLSLVENGRVEFSIGTPDVLSDAITRVTLLRDQLSLVCRADMPLAKRQHPTWEEVVALECITVRRGGGIRTLIDQTLSKLNLSFEPAFEVTYLTTALALAARGLGVAILPGYLVASLQPILVARRIQRPVVSRDLSLMHLADRTLSPAAQALIEVLRTTLGERAV